MDSLPMRGWSCVGLDDLGPDAVQSRRFQCEMCGTPWLRYVHRMQHPEASRELRVGCECAARMEQDPTAAKEREKNHIQRIKRRNKWLQLDGWRVSRKGNSYLNKNGMNVAVWPEGGDIHGNVWHWRVLCELRFDKKGNRLDRRSSDYTRYRADLEWSGTEESEDAAKLTCFEHMPENNEDVAEAIKAQVAKLRDPEFRELVDDIEQAERSIDLFGSRNSGELHPKIRRPPSPPPRPWPRKGLTAREILERRRRQREALNCGVHATT